MSRVSLLATAAVLCVAFAAWPAAQKESPKMIRAAGTFDVKLSPQPLADTQADSLLSRLAIDKQFHGDLAGVSKGEMLAARTATEGSAGYVAMERVTGTLHGKKGSFVLQHSGTVTRGQQQLDLRVVPDSGTGELAGLAGTMSIKIETGKHFYELVYSLR